MSDYNPNYLDFEKPLLEIDNKIKAIKTSASASQKDINKIETLNKDLEKSISKIFSSLSIGKYLKLLDTLLDHIHWITYHICSLNLLKFMEIGCLVMIKQLSADLLNLMIYL